MNENEDIEMHMVVLGKFSGGKERSCSVRWISSHFLSDPNHHVCEHFRTPHTVSAWSNERSFGHFDWSILVAERPSFFSSKRGKFWSQNREKITQQHKTKQVATDHKEVLRIKASTAHHQAATK